jgi:hypothetical protein
MKIHLPGIGGQLVPVPARRTGTEGSRYENCEGEARIFEEGEGD